MTDLAILTQAEGERPIAARASQNYGMMRIEASALGADLLPSPAFADALAAQILGGERSPRFALLYGLLPLLRERSRLDTDEAVLAGRRFFRAAVDGLSARILADAGLSSLVNPLGVSFQTIEYGFDGFNANQGYQPYAEMQVRDGFVSTKCIHFDAAEPIATNIYGPCVNIAGGFPVIADAMMYCRDEGLRIGDIVERLEGYPVSFRAPHYRRLVEDYSIAFDVEMKSDTPCLITLNDILAGGIAHGATVARPRNSTDASKRPLWHIAFDYERLADIDRWYAALRLDAPEPRSDDNRDEKNLIDEHNRLCARGPLTVGPGLRC